MGKLSSTSMIFTDIEVSTESGYPISDCFDLKGSSPGGTISVALKNKTAFCLFS